METGIYNIRVEAESCINPSFNLPPFLLLIKGNNYHLFRIGKQSNPIFANREQLSELGFEPVHEYYWIINLDKRVTCDLSDYMPKWKNKRNRKPYLDYIDISKFK